MKLSQLDRSHTATKALKANFGLDFDTSKLDRVATKNMMAKVKGLMIEAKESPEFYRDQSNPTYMKLVFMAQALVEHYNSFKTPRIIFENEEVEKSQVILAAQDMVDSVQKMIEDVSDMLVKELPALTDSIQSEIGVNESDQFNQQVTEALTSLQSALTQSQGTLKGALGTITGQGDSGFDADVGSEEEVGIEEPAPVGGEEMVDVDITEPVASEEEPLAPLGGAGRPKR